MVVGTLLLQENNKTVVNIEVKIRIDLSDTLITMDYSYSREEINKDDSKST
ncbi:MAG: hypothetical protein WBM99_14895 [Psychromonas sp.]